MASKSSTISATSHDGGNSSRTKEGGNRKENEDHSSKSNSKSIDFMKLSKDNSVRGLKVQEHNFLSPIHVGSSSRIPNNNNEGKDENNNEEKNSDSRNFKCSYCKARFSTAQALGGHQNAHRAERALEKQRKERYDGGALTLGKHHFNPYFSYPSTPLTPYNHRALGVKIESTIQKPPYTNPRITPHSSRYGHDALCLQEILNPSLVSLKNNIEGSNAGVGILGIGGASTSRIEDGTNKIRAILNLGNSFTNVASSSNSNINKKSIVAPTSTMDGIHNSKAIIEEEPSDSKSSELDLTLKL